MYHISSIVNFFFKNPIELLSYFFFKNNDFQNLCKKLAFGKYSNPRDTFKFVKISTFFYEIVFKTIKFDDF